MAHWDEKYELVIGLEVHAQLLTQSKLFSSDAALFNAGPNENISAVTLAHPGTLPKLNKAAVELAVRMGIACNCEIEEVNTFARKHYFYPDLPKAYQTSQHTSPVCKGGYISIRTKQGVKQIPLNRIHLEEDAGKSIHDLSETESYIDYNRAGTPLIEIVTEPAIHSADDAYLFLTELRRLVRWIEVCDGNMEEGSLRCDANISLRKKGEAVLGTKVEVKNLNSIRNVKKAIEFETQRIAVILDKGEAVIQQTRSFDAATETTFAIRDKEEANDYRYFPDPDLPPFILTEQHVNRIKTQMPKLPQQWISELEKQFGLNEYDASQIATEKETADFFLTTTKHASNYKAIANWLNGPIKEYMNTEGISFSEFHLKPASLAEIIALIDSGKISFSAAASKLLPAMIAEPDRSANDVAEKLELFQTNDNSEIENWINTALANLPDKVLEYKKGKKGLIGLFMGEVKKISKGKADPKAVTQMLEEKLKS